MTQSSQPVAAPTVSSCLAEPLEVGEPSSCGALTLFPITGPEPVQDYTSFAQGREAGVVVKELDEGASVNDIVVENPTQTPVLLFEGEEVLGAQQNRTFDATILVGAGSKLRIPVSCVEAGRWDGARSGEHFEPAPQAAHPELRRAKARQVRANLEGGGPARASQGQVWDNVAAKSARMPVNSSTRALHDVYEGHRDRLNEFREAIRLRDGQSGALVAIGDRFVVLDWVSRPEVYASLHSALLQGYALDALEGEAAEAPTHAEAEGFVSLATQARSSERDGIGMGHEVRFEEAALIGTGLASGDELVQLTVHNGDGDCGVGSSSIRSGRVRRPSRRSL